MLCHVSMWIGIARTRVITLRDPSPGEPSSSRLAMPLPMCHQRSGHALDHLCTRWQGASRWNGFLCWPAYHPSPTMQSQSLSTSHLFGMWLWGQVMAYHDAIWLDINQLLPSLACLCIAWQFSAQLEWHLVWHDWFALALEHDIPDIQSSVSSRREVYTRPACNILGI